MSEGLVPEVRGTVWFCISPQKSDRDLLQSMKPFETNVVMNETVKWTWKRKTCLKLLEDGCALEERKGNHGKWMYT